MGSEPTDLNDIETLQRQIAELQAKLSAAQQANVTGSGAIAQGGGDALGERSIKVEENSGTIVTGTQIVTNYYAASGQLTKEEIAQQVVGYLLWLQARTESIELRGIERAGGAPVVLLPLETAYVPLRARSMPRVGDAQGAMVVHGRPSRSRRDRADDAEHGEREVDIALR